MRNSHETLHSGATGFFEIMDQRFTARFTFMREYLVIFLFVLRAIFEEAPEINEPVRSHVQKLCDKENEEVYNPLFVELTVTYIIEQKRKAGGTENE